MGGVGVRGWLRGDTGRYWVFFFGGGGWVDFGSLGGLKGFGRVTL